MLNIGTALYLVRFRTVVLRKKTAVCATKIIIFAYDRPSVCKTEANMTAALCRLSFAKHVNAVCKQKGIYSYGCAGGIT